MGWIAAALLASGCVEQPDGDLRLSWSFLDGRDCSSSGVGPVSFEVRRGARLDAEGERGCLEGAVGEGASVEAGRLPPGRYTLRVEARSFEGAPLYAREREVWVVSGEWVVAEVELVPVGP